MAQIRDMAASDAERVRDLWYQMCADAGTPLPAAAAPRILANLRQYATHPAVHCFVAAERQTLIGFVTCSVTAHPVLPGRTGEIEELYVQPPADRQAVRTALVRHAVPFLQIGGAGSIHTRICAGPECPAEADLRAFWQSIGWDNDMVIYSIYSNVPADPALQHVWDGYRGPAQAGPSEQ